MDPEVKGRVERYLDALESGLTWAGGEVGETVREFVVWRCTESFLTAAVYVGLAVVSFLAARRWPERIAAWAKGKNYTFESDPPVFFAMFAAWLVRRALPVAFVLMACGAIGRGVKVLVAPRVVLLEEVAGVVYSHGGTK